MSRYRYYNMILDSLYAFCDDYGYNAINPPVARDIMVIMTEVSKTCNGIMLSNVSDKWSYE